MGIFTEKFAHIWDAYRISVQMRSHIFGGIPSNPKLMEGWLAKNTGIENKDEMREIMIRTLRETGRDIDGGMSYEELLKLGSETAETNYTNVFKRDTTGLYIEARQVKAAFKEAISVVFSGEKFGATRKGPKNFLAERVFVAPERIYLLRDGKPIRKADGRRLIIGHISGPMGTTSVMTYYEYVINPAIDFDVLSLNTSRRKREDGDETKRTSKNYLDEDTLQEILTYEEENGLGAIRSQEQGQFDITAWERIPNPLAVRRTTLPWDPSALEALQAIREELGEEAVA